MRRSRGNRRDKWTIALGGAALLTAGSVLMGEALRLRSKWQKRSAEATVAEEIAEETVEVARSGYQATPHSEQILFSVMTGFLLGFILPRLSTHGIRSGWWPTGNTFIANRHIHHFVPGIIIAFLAGGGGLALPPEHQAKAAALMGFGMGMTLDEAALLLELRDVYWSPEGVFSVQASLGITSLLGGTLVALRMLRRGEEVEELPAPGEWGRDE